MHGHEEFKYFVIPKTRTEFWLNKINKNKKRDLKNEKTLKYLGWNIITVWECDLKNEKFETSVKKILFEIKVSTLNNLIFFIYK